MTPAKNAQRLLLGTGLGLILASGLALISGVFTVENPNVGVIVPLVGIILLALSGPTGRGEGPLGEIFPDENDSIMTNRIENELNKHQKIIDNNYDLIDLYENKIKSNLDEIWK